MQELLFMLSCVRSKNGIITELSQFFTSMPTSKLSLRVVLTPGGSASLWVTKDFRYSFSFLTVQVLVRVIGYTYPLGWCWQVFYSVSAKKNKRSMDIHCITSSQCIDGRCHDLYMIGVLQLYMSRSCIEIYLKCQSTRPVTLLSVLVFQG